MALDVALQRLVDWFWGQALPLWASCAADDAGGFFESLDFSGAPGQDAFRRVRVQARQIHVFATTARLGRHREAQSIARRGFDYFLAHACPQDGRRGCVHILAPDGGIVDARRDLYDQAFLLLACASHWRAFGDPRSIDLAVRTIAFLDAELKVPGGGYQEDDCGTRPRRQNPHMHLFEAFMALYSATDEREYLERAAGLQFLLQMRFLDWRAQALREFFSDDLLAPEPHRGDIVEPGHMAEWVWLLQRYESLSGGDVGSARDLLYARAIETGADSASGFLVDSVRLGEKPGGARRLWPQTEYLKASLVMARSGDREAAARAENLIGRLFETYFRHETPGLWCDQYDSAGLPVARSVPASMLYHILEAALEAESYLKDSAL